ncbi:MAG: hypothetical protein HQL69_18925 [Magnetococcales bacterium]|nr:hypothetical protein [Magnetococcales bacterium]
MNKNLQMALMVSVPLEGWESINRRVRYLEALLAQVLNNNEGIKEWYSSTELASLKLIGLPEKRAGITRMAGKKNWTRRVVKGRGTPFFEYHYTSLPEKAFNELIEWIYSNPAKEVKTKHSIIPVVPPLIEEPQEIKVDYSTRQWMLPLMRVIKGGNVKTLGDVVKKLPEYLDNEIEQPTGHEIEEALREIGVIANK